MAPMLVSGECCVLSAFANGKYFGSMLAYDHELSTDFYANEIKNFFMGTVNQGEIMLNYINSNKDKNYSFFRLPYHRALIIIKIKWLLYYNVTATLKLYSIMTENNFRQRCTFHCSFGHCVQILHCEYP